MKSKHRRKGRMELWIMIIPVLILLLIYNYGPMFGLVMAFQDFKPALGFFHSKWVGMENFKFIFSLPDVPQVIWNTLRIAVLKIVFETVAAIVTAVLLNEIRQKWFKRTVQTIVYFPYFLSWVILAGIFRDILASDGLVNVLLGHIGVDPVPFLSSPKIFPWVLVFTEVWQVTGFNTIVYLAAITAISPALYEAAAIDGAGRIKQTWYVTIPSMLPTIMVMLILSLGSILNAGFDQVLNLYSPAVYATGDVIDTWVYRAGLQDAQYSIGAAFGLFRSVVSFIMVSVSYWIAYKKADYRIF